MEKHWIFFLLLFFSIESICQPIVIGPKGTKLTLDSSKWKLEGNNIYNKNASKVGIGTSNPTAQLHSLGTVRLEGIGSNSVNTRVLTADSLGNITTRLTSSILSENELTFSNGLTKNLNTVTVNTTQNITTLSNLTSNGFIKTSGGNGTLSIASSGTDYTAGTASLGTGILKSTTGTGILSIATASDFPILNQNTTGNAATVTTNANLTGPVTSIGNVTNIANNVITNSMLSQIGSQTFKGRTTAGSGNVEDLSATQATAMLNTFTTSANGLVPASGVVNNNTFLRSDGTWSIPILRTFGTSPSDINSTSTTLVSVTGLSFNVVANTTYRFRAMIPFTSTATNNGTRWTIDGPTSSLIYYCSRYTNGSNTETINYCNNYLQPLSANNNSVSYSIVIIEGVITPSVSGTIQVKFASGSTASITAKSGATIEYW